MIVRSRSGLTSAKCPVAPMPALLMSTSIAAEVTQGGAGHRLAVLARA